MLRFAINHIKGKRIASCTWIVALSSLAPMASAQWPQWGGKNRDFVADAKDLAAVWPEGGPKKIWSRTLGPGYSSISVADDHLYTMYRESDTKNDGVRHEIAVALDAQTGKIAWEYKYPAPWPEGVDMENKEGPNATPLVHGGKVYTFGATGKLHCIDQKSGKPVWSRDVVAEYGAKVPGFGFASSPLMYKNSLILPVGGPGVGVIAFKPAGGEVLWKKHDFAGTHSSPIVVQVDGRDEIVLLAGTEVVGMDPATGDIDWRYPFKSDVMTPLWGDDGILFISSADHGSRGLKLIRKDGKVIVEELWTATEVQVGFTNAVRSANLILACSSKDEKNLMTALDAATGKIAWRDPGFGLANLVSADGKLIILDHGSLSLATATPKAFELKSKVPLLKKSIWSNPTIVGQRLFVRDQEEILAVDLGNGASGSVQIGAPG